MTQAEAESDNAVAFCTDSKQKSGNIKPFSKKSTAKFRKKKSIIGPCRFCKSYGHLMANCKKSLNSVGESKFK